MRGVYWSCRIDILVFIMIQTKFLETNYSIYLLGEIPNRLTISCRKKFKHIERFLREKGYVVVNPVEEIMFNEDRKEAEKENLKKLVACNAVYILSDIALSKYNLAEIELAIGLNLLIIHDVCLFTNK
ncbi:DUF4406 domain-containing protein [Flavobacterium sp. SUN046]|uniref:DUF4406 domain-containing protein n=1 Tax=Flavobacterium sp. SUN046 TaxID=3002440 RepID=UPI002DBE662F|nr:DUF4406 domain-containing protein [Flavobacterium sp. SUN046]MEC4050483.1 DUF4406 domain-containing protein [Flavobacterium sp. SUN046]